VGTDIHLHVEKYNEQTGKWEWVKECPEQFRNPWYKEMRDSGKSAYYETAYRQSFYSDRCYDAFAVLAGVRNGFGFAGCETGEGFTPISEPRGLPDDLSEELRQVRHRYEYDDTEIHTDFGDHSQSWVTLAELQAVDWEAKYQKTGVVAYSHWKPTEIPEEYCGGVTGRGIVVMDGRDPRDVEIIRKKAEGYQKDGLHVYVKVQWYETVGDLVGSLKTRLIPALESLGGKPEHTRIVFGFDS